MITGKLPFMGEYEQAVSYAIVNEEQEPITALRTGVPMELERIVNRALAKDPKDRYQHADDLLSELNRLKKDSDSDKKPIKTISEKKKKNVVVLPAIVLSTVVLIIAGYFVLKPSLPEKAELPSSEWENSIAVLPFADLSPEKDQDWFCDGMTEQIITNLSKIKRLMVIGRTSVMKFKDTQKTLPEIGKELNISYLLEGSIRKYGNSIRVTAQLINTEDGSHLWAEDFDRKLEHVFDVQDDVSQAIALNLLATFSPEEKTDIKMNRPSSTEAYENYLKGLHYLQTDEEADLLRSAGYFQRAIELARTYAIAYAELANVYQRMTGLAFISKDEGYPESLAAVERALELEPELNEAHLALARIKFILEWDWEGAERAFLKVLKQNPSSAKGHERYAVYLVMMGRFEDATREILLARELDPLSPWINNNVGWIYYFRRQYRKAMVEYQNNLEMHPNFSMSHRELSLVYLFSGMPDEAVESAEKAVAISDDPQNIADLGFIYAMVGEHEKANEIVQQLLERSKTKPLPLYQLSYIFGALGENDKAFKYLEQAYEEHSGWALQIKVDPAVDNLRSDPRFTPFVRKMGLEP
jgi:TolB-like protein/Flp pilus assembly protein TadD